jgi:hypothetical protein
MVNRSIGKDAMAEVKDVTGPTLCAIENPFDLSLNEMDRTKENHRIEISLNGDIVPKTCPGLTNIHSPIHPYHISPCALHEFQEC